MMRIALTAAIVAALALPAFGQTKTRESEGIGGVFGWFPDNRRDLKEMVEKFLADAPDVKVEGKPIAVIVPHGQYKFCGPTAAAAFKALAGQTYDRVVILGPAHNAAFPGGHVGEWDYYSTPMGSSELDKIACRKLLTSGAAATQPKADEKEQSIQNVLPFLETLLNDVKIVPVLIGGKQSENSIRRLGDAVRSVSTPDTLYVVSTDFTAYGQAYFYTPYKDNLKENIRKGDQAAIDLILSNNLAGFRALMKKPDALNLDGAEAISVLLRALEGRKDIRGRLLQYANTAEMIGDYSKSTSFAGIVLTKVAGAAEEPLKVETIIEDMGDKKPEKVPQKLSEADEQTLLQIARDQLTKTIKDKKTADPSEYRADVGRKLLSQGATSVVLRKNDRLRGESGDVRPEKPIYISVLWNTIRAARDSHFAKNPITEADLPDVDIEITVLSPFVAAAGYTDIEMGKHGVFMSKGTKYAIMLPRTALEAHWDRDAMLKQLCLKAGLGENDYKDAGCRFWVFEAQTFCESEYRMKDADKK